MIYGAPVRQLVFCFISLDKMIINAYRGGGHEDVILMTCDDDADDDRAVFKRQSKVITRLRNCYI